MKVEVAIVGGGPAGLAVAIEAAARGFEVALFERQERAPDKACGEGILPAGVACLRRLGALKAIREHPRDHALISGLRYVEEDGRGVESPWPGLALTVRRTLLERTLAERAESAGARLHFGCAARRFRIEGEGVRLETDAGEVEARLLVAADGLHSPIRRAAGLEGRPLARHRLGMRRHFATAPWSSLVEVYWGDGMEAYVTPVGPARVGVAVLWDAARQRRRPSLDPLFTGFGLLRERLGEAAPETAIRGAGPFGGLARSAAGQRLALIGDAAGTLDPISGEGISLALQCAAGLGELLEGLVRRRDPGPALEEYARLHRRAYRRAALLPGLLLQLSDNPALRRAAFGALQRAPAIFRAIVTRATAPVAGPGPDLQAMGPAATNPESRAP